MGQIASPKKNAGKCYGKSPNESDRLFRRSKAGSVTNQYNEMGMIDGAGSSSPVHEPRAEVS